MGTHGLEVHAIDTTNMSATTAISIEQGPACTASGGCEGTDVCVAGGCIPGPGEPGGLGSICQTPHECISMTCASGGEQFMHCVAECDPGMGGACPDGFDCLENGASGVCWPSSGGCCSASGDPRGSLLLGAIVLAGALRRRRR
jgi:MYXO-CTERM domain-containing protein